MWISHLEPRGYHFIRGPSQSPYQEELGQLGSMLTFFCGIIAFLQESSFYFVFRLVSFILEKFHSFCQFQEPNLFGHTKAKLAILLKTNLDHDKLTVKQFLFVTF